MTAWTARLDALREGARTQLVVTRLFSLLREVAWSSRLPEQRAAVREQLGRLQAAAADHGFDESERERLAVLGEQVEHALDGRWDTAA